MSYSTHQFFGYTYYRFLSFHSFAEFIVAQSQSRITSNGFPGTFHYGRSQDSMSPRCYFSHTLFSPEERVEGTKPIKLHNLSKDLNLSIFSSSVKIIIAVIKPIPGILISSSTS